MNTGYRLTKLWVQAGHYRLCKITGRFGKSAQGVSATVALYTEKAWSARANTHIHTHSYTVFAGTTMQQGWGAGLVYTVIQFKRIDI